MESVSQAMHFKNPEVLYALLLLVIPLIVHLFQLRKFRREKFTNVKFLKKAIQQTRKSSRLQKWLVLFSRMFLLACLVLAFAQPYFPAEEDPAETETVIYLDNSFSMQAKGKKGILLKRGIQDLLESLPEEGNLSLFTNSEEFSDIEVSSLRKKLQETSNSAGQNSWNEIALKAQNLFSQRKNTQKNFIVISDFQLKEDQVSEIEGVDSYLVRLEPEELRNTALDTAFVASRTLDEITLAINISGNSPQEVPVAVYDGNRLLAKKTVALDEDLAAETSFTFPAGPMPQGRISIEDNGLLFDNNLYFSINDVPPVNVVVVGDENSDFLHRIYTAPEFNLQVLAEENLDFSALSRANLIILNELEKISPALSDQVLSLAREDVLVAVIPSESANLEDLNSFLSKIELPSLRQKIPQEKLVTNIAFQHPLYESVFDEKVDNFQYPQVNSYYRTATPATNVLSFETGEPFLLEQGNNFLFASPLNEDHSNFKNSPLVVPTFYNFGNLSVSPDELYYVLGNDQEITVQASLNKDQILKLSSSDYTFIPQQQSSQNTVKLYLNDHPAEQGHYELIKDSVALKTLSFNMDRSESRMEYSNLENSENIRVFSSVPDVFQKIEAQNEVNSLWKWFVIFATFFLISEMLILKFLK